MPILSPRDQAAVRKEFERIAGPVKLVVFSQSLAAPELCQQNEQLAVRRQLGEAEQPGAVRGVDDREPPELRFRRGRCPFLGHGVVQGALKGCCGAKGLEAPVRTSREKRQRPQSLRETVALAKRSIPCRKPPGSRTESITVR